ncbi:Release factor glutamine methyltransferase [subsurface metagenome]
MIIKNIWEKYYQETPLEKIPWQKTQADYFLKLLNSGKLGKGKALDLGCGTGKKSIALAKKGFNVTGIDISPTAIRYAKKNAKKEKVKIKFYAKNATNLSFLGNKKFDFILDWANLHGIPKSQRKRYIAEIIKHTKKEGKFLLRCFSKREIKKKFARRQMGPIYFFSRKDITKLFSNHFKILRTHKSKPFVMKEKEPPAKWLDEYLMQKID